MASWEIQLISRIVGSGDLRSVIEWGITEHDFLTNEGRALFNMLCGYYEQAESSGTVLGQHALHVVVPNFVLCDDPSVTTEFLCSAVRRQRMVIQYRALIEQQLQLLEQDPMRAVNQTHTAMADLQRLGSSRTKDVPFNESFSRSVRRMELIEQGVDLSCGAWPWDPLQDATGGIEPADYVVLYGRPKQMKSWVLAYLISWFYEQGKKMLIYTKEMVADNIFQRAGACLASVRYHEFRRGRLSPAERNSVYTVERMLHQAQALQTVICLSAEDATDGEDSVPWLEAKVEQYKPDVIFIDGMYLMSDVKNAREDNKRVRNISRAIRAMVLKLQIPVIATVQANRDAAKNKKANLDEVAFSDALSQDATLLMRVINEEGAPTLALVLGGATREFALNGFRIFGVPALNFEYYGPLTDQEIESAKANDVPDGMPKKKAEPKAARPTEGKQLVSVTKALDQQFR